MTRQRARRRREMGRTRKWRVATVALVVLGAALPAGAQEASGPETYARRGMIIGGISVGILGGLAVGTLASALCEYECGGAFLGGAAIGGVVGGALGGATGLIIGAAIPRARQEEAPGAGGDPDRVGAEGGPAPARRGSWTMRLAAGPRWTGEGETDRLAAWASLTTLRATSERIDWGLEVGYLGTRATVTDHTFRSGTGATVFQTTRLVERTLQLSMVATRTLGSVTSPRGYLLASAGVYPLQESFHTERTGDVDELPLVGPTTRRETTPFPGVGIGGGGLWALGSKGGIGVDGRLHLMMGAGDGIALPLATLGATLWLGR